MLRIVLLIFLIILSSHVNANKKDQIINKLNNTLNLNFDFEQNINGKIEFGNCTIQYPKKMFCDYDKKNKVIVSNGKSLVIKSTSSYYRYPLDKTPLTLFPCISTCTTRPFSTSDKNSEKIILFFWVKDPCGFLNIL